LLDALLGEPRRYHPLVGFGLCAGKLEQHLNNKPDSELTRFKGALALLLLVTPLVFAVIVIQHAVAWPQLIEIIVLYLAVGRKSLMQHAQAIIKPLQMDDLSEARQNIARIVSRDTRQMQKKDVVKAGIESVIENSNDAIFGAIFWFLIAGAPGVLMYRLVNTLDAMWGYKNKRFKRFGWVAARLDDVLNWLPARLTVLSFALSARFLQVIKTSMQQGAQCASPNAGPVMAAGACALKIKLGGDAFYQGKKISKPELGLGHEPEIQDIQRAMQLVNRTVVLWLFTLTAIVLLIEVWRA